MCVLMAITHIQNPFLAKVSIEWSLATFYTNYKWFITLKKILVTSLYGLLSDGLKTLLTSIGNIAEKKCWKNIILGKHLYK